MLMLILMLTLILVLMLVLKLAPLLLLVQRAALLAHMISLALELRRLRNYNGVMAVLAGPCPHYRCYFYLPKE